MASKSYEYQVLERANYHKQHIVPFKGTLEPLAPSSIRVQPSVIALTQNNVTYARLGDVLNWWSAHPIPDTDGQFSDTQKYGRTNAWGTGRVIESTADFVLVGTVIWGYFPLASLPLDKEVKKTSQDNVFIETSSHRQELLTMYNRYFVVDKKQANDDTYHAYAALVKVLFETSYHLNRLVFGWNPEVPPVNPAGLDPPPAVDTWDKRRANLRNATVVIFPASSKTAFSFAYAIRNLRPKDEQPRAIVGATSDASRQFCEELGLYDQLVDYDLAKSGTAALGSELDIAEGDTILLADFGAREGIMDLWRGMLESLSKDFTLLRVGATIPEVDDGESAQSRLKTLSNAGPNAYLSNASPQRDAGMKIYGEAEYLGDLDKAYDSWVESGGLSPLKLEWGRGVSGENGIEGGWSRLVAGKFGASEGLVFKLD